MAGITNVVIIFCRAGHGESVMSANRVLHHFNQRRQSPDHNIWNAVQASNRRGPSSVRDVVTSNGRSHAAVDFAGEKHWKSVHLPPVDIENLDVLARFYKIGLARSADFTRMSCKWICQGIWQIELADEARAARSTNSVSGVSVDCSPGNM